MMKIGAFSRLCRVPVKTLRYYDEIGLLHPAEVDTFTGYRYYTLDQVPRINRILALKDLGFSLEEIGRALNEDLTLAEMRGMLKLRRAEISAVLHEEEARLARVEARMKQIEMEGNMPEYEIILKEVDEITVVMMRSIISNYASVGELAGPFFEEVGKAGIMPVGPVLGVYYDKEFKEQDVDIALAVPVEPGTPASPPLTLQTLPAVSMASLTRIGPYDDFMPAYLALFGWVEANGYRVAGPNREVYLRSIGDNIAPEEYVTDIQVPIVKA